MLSHGVVDPAGLAYEPVYAQRAEQTLIMDRLGARTGRLLDIGAYDGVSFSNSRRLIEIGWSGVLVEPQPEAFDRLARLYEGVEHVTLVNAAVAPTPGLRPFHVSRRSDGADDYYGALDKDETRRWEGHDVSFQRVLVSCVDWGMLLNAVGRDFDFITIDVEGGNTELLTSLDLGDIRGVRLLCVEKDLPPGGDHAALRARQIDHAGAHAFRLLHETPENLFFERGGP